MIETEEYILPGNAACQGCSSLMCLRIVLKALRGKAALVIPASCTSVYMGPYPYTAIKVPVFNCAFASAASTATGLRAAFDFYEEDGEVVVWAGDGGTYDIGLQALSGAAERGENIIYICYNNEMYSNTGVQRSGATPYGAWTNTTIKGKKEHRKDIPEILLSHGIPYLATASSGYLRDLYKKVKKALEFEGFRYIEILTPCPSGWKFPMNKTVEIGKLAVETGLWILYEAEYGKIRFTGISKAIAEGKKEMRNIRDYLKAQGRFANLSEDDIAEIERHRDLRWEILKRRALSNRAQKYF